MKRASLALVVLLVPFGIGACLPISTPLPPLPTETALPPTQTATPTPVWFPPTPTNTPLPTSVVTPTVSVKPELGEISFTDNFSNPAIWATGKRPAGRISLGKGELTLAINQPGGYLFSLRQGSTLGNFYAEITASPSICLGGDEYGMLIHFSPDQEFYRFSLTCDGQVRLDKYFNGKASSPQPLTPNGSIPPGAPSISRLAVLANGNVMSFFANGEYLFTVRDPSLPVGSLGVFAHSASDNAVTVNFSDLVVYQTAK
jgi:hypothetical protein